MAVADATPPQGPPSRRLAVTRAKLLANLATDLFIKEKVTTTLPRARAVRPLAEKLITKARKNDLHSKRTVLKTITNREAVSRLFDEVAPRYADRPGGYTRITKLGPRRGDGAEEAIIELV